MKIPSTLSSSTVKVEELGISVCNKRTLKESLLSGSSILAIEDDKVLRICYIFIFKGKTKCVKV